MSTPYTYLITFTHPVSGDQLFYYGCQYSDKANPANLWTTYFSSSKHVAALRETYPDECFKHEVRVVFSDPKKAIEHEWRVIGRLKLPARENWLNNHYAPGILMTEDVRQKISEAAIGRNVGENNPMFGKTHTEEARKAISEARSNSTASETTKDSISKGLKKAYVTGGRSTNMEAARKARAKSIVVNGVQYPSITEYCRQTGKSRKSFYSNVSKISF